jgi:UDP-N-acetylglucosamine 1-carboxyvinyltransferase
LSILAGVRGADGSTASTVAVRRSGPLDGRVRIHGAKNSVLKLMGACLLAEGTHELRNVPGISDVGVMADLLRALGLAVEIDGSVVRVTTPSVVTPLAPFELMQSIRASIVVLGPLLARCGEATVGWPGGDDFGSRPIDLHIRGLEALGARFEQSDDVLRATVDGQLAGAEILLEFPSVGATENIVLAAVLAKGTTVLDNAAREPEIADLCRFLVAMGADIDGIGSSTIVIHGCEPADLHPAVHDVVPDRLEAATHLCALGAVGGEIELRGAEPRHMEMLLIKLRDAGMRLTATEGGLLAEMPRRPRAVQLATLPYPGVATDYKPMLAAMLTVADGTSVLSENLFSGRFRYVDELARLGASIKVEDRHLVVWGQERLRGDRVTAHDIRAGAALVIAGLAADGETVIEGGHHIDRGYTDLVADLTALGARLERR